MEKQWHVYLLMCADGTTYCGMTNDLQGRLDAHNAGKGAKYTRGRLPVRLLAYRTVGSRSEALRLEARVKRCRREEKVRILSGGEE